MTDFPQGSGVMISPTGGSGASGNASAWTDPTNIQTLQGNPFAMWTITDNEKYQWSSAWSCYPSQGGGGLSNNDEGFYAPTGPSVTYPTLYNTGSSWGTTSFSSGYIGAILDFEYEGMSRTCFNYLYAHIWANWEDRMYYMHVSRTNTQKISNNAKLANGGKLYLQFNYKAMMRNDGVTFQPGPFLPSSFDDLKHGSTSTGAGQQPVTIVVERSVPGYTYISPLDIAPDANGKGTAWTMMGNPWQTIGMATLIPGSVMRTGAIELVVDAQTLESHYIRVRSITGHMANNSGGELGPNSWGFSGSTGSASFPTAPTVGAGLDHDYATQIATCLSFGGVTLSWPPVTCFVLDFPQLIIKAGVPPCDVTNFNEDTTAGFGPETTGAWTFLNGAASQFHVTGGIATATTDSRLRFRVPIRWDDQNDTSFQMERLFWNVSKSSYPGSSNYTLNVTIGNDYGAAVTGHVTQSGTSLNMTVTDNRGNPTATYAPTPSEVGVANGEWVYMYLQGSRTNSTSSTGFSAGYLQQTTPTWNVSTGFLSAYNQGDAGVAWGGGPDASWLAQTYPTYLEVDFDPHGEMTTFNFAGFELGKTGLLCPLTVPCACFGGLTEVDGRYYTSGGPEMNLDGIYTVDEDSVVHASIIDNGNFNHTFGMFSGIFNDFSYLAAPCEFVYRFKIIGDIQSAPTSQGLYVFIASASSFYTYLYVEKDYVQVYPQYGGAINFTNPGLDWSREISVKFRWEREASSWTAYRKWWNTDDGEPSDWGYVEGGWTYSGNQPYYVEVDVGFEYQSTYHDYAIDIYPVVVTAGDLGYPVNACASTSYDNTKFATSVVTNEFGSCGGFSGDTGSGINYLTGNGNPFG